jgi:hypothetical protein
MTTSQCGVADCDRKHYAKGWCMVHWKRWRKHGDLDHGRRTRGVCSIDGCDRPHSNKGWCKSHYMRWYRYGDPLRQPTPRPPRTTRKPRAAPSPPKRAPRPSTTKARAQLANIEVSAYNPRPRPGYWSTAELLATLDRETERSLRLDPPR